MDRKEAVAETLNYVGMLFQAKWNEHWYRMCLIRDNYKQGKKLNHVDIYVYNFELGIIEMLENFQCYDICIFINK